MKPDLFSPHRAQEAFLDDYDHRYCAFVGGWGAGKSYAGSRKLANQHAYNGFDDKGHPTYIKGLIVAPTYGLAQTINIPQMMDAFKAMGLSYRFVADPKRYLFELPDLGTKSRPSEILVRSADNPMMIAGFEVAHIWGDEAARWYSNDSDPTQDAMLQCEGRLRAANARVSQMNLTFTHEGDLTRVYERFESEAKADHRLYRSSTRENTHLPAGYIAGLESNLTPELAKQYLDGHAANFKGSNVYDNFDEAANLDATLDLDPKRPLQLCIDFNTDPGTHVEIGQHFPDRDLLTTVHELYEPRMNTKTFIPVLRKFLGSIGSLASWKFPGKLELFGDASGGNANLATGESCWQILAEGLKSLGIPFSMANVPAANPHVADRVNATNCAFRSMTGNVRYKIHPRCVRLVKDYKTMKWAGNEMDKKDRKISHASDADGYRIVQLMPIRKMSIPSGRVMTA